MSPACSPGIGCYPSPNKVAVVFSGRPGIRGPSRMYAMREMTENAAIVNTHFLLNPSASSGITGISLKMSSGRMQPGSRAFLRHGPAEAAAIFVGTAEPAPFLQSIENARPTDLRRLCGGFAAALRRLFRCRPVAIAASKRPGRCGRAGSAACRRRICRRTCRRTCRRRASGRPGGAPAKAHGNGPDTRIPGYGDAPGAASEAPAGRSGLRFVDYSAQGDSSQGG